MHEIEIKYLPTYSTYFACLHLNSVAEYIQVLLNFQNGPLFESYLTFVESCLDVVEFSNDPLISLNQLCKNVNVILAPSLDSLSDSLNPQLMTV